MGDAEVFAKDFGVILFGESRISFLLFAEQAFFCGKERAAAVHLNASAFKDHAASFVKWLPDAAFQLLIGFGDDCGILLVIRIFGPAVESEMVAGDFAGTVSNADGAGVAHPAAIGWHAEKIHGIEICSGLFQDGSNARFGGAVFDQEINAFDRRQMADDFSKGPGNGRKFSRPVGYFMRPAEPGGFVRFPFGGHAETESVRRFDRRRRFHWTKEFNTEIAEGTEST